MWKLRLLGHALLVLQIDLELGGQQVYKAKEAHRFRASGANLRGHVSRFHRFIGKH